MARESVEIVGVAVKTTSAVFLFTQLAGWAIALAGVAILQQNCNSNNQDFNFPAPAFGLGPNVVAYSIALAESNGGPLPLVISAPTPYECGVQYSWFWWVLALQAITLVAGILVTFSRLRSGKLWVAAFYSIVTALWCIFAYASTWETVLYQRWGHLRDNKWATGYVLGAAGSVIVLVGNFLFLVALGTQDVTGLSAVELGTTKAAEPLESAGPVGITTRGEAASTAV